MCSVSFHGESAGSIGYLDKVSSRGGESAGSIGKITNAQGEATLVQAPECDTVNFKGLGQNFKLLDIHTIRD